MRVFLSPDRTRWGVEVQSPGASNAMLVFHHPNGRTARLDRYAWVQLDQAEASDVTARVDPAKVLGALTDSDLTPLFRRSMRISAATHPRNVPITHAG
jgi:hypothetical protein